MVRQPTREGSEQHLQNRLRKKSVGGLVNGKPPNLSISVSFSYVVAVMFFLL